MYNFKIYEYLIYTYNLTPYKAINLAFFYTLFLEGIFCILFILIGGR